MCECLEEAFVLSKAHEKTKSESTKKSIDKEIKILARHCHRLAWRGATCSQEELSLIIKKQAPTSLWDLGEGITLVMRRPYAWPASYELESAKRYQADSTLKVFPRMYNDSLGLLQGPYHLADSTKGK